MVSYSLHYGTTFDCNDKEIEIHFKVKQLKLQGCVDKHLEPTCIGL